MKPWTDEARRIFEGHGESRRAALLAAGADPDEVIGDWRAHVAEEAERRPEPEVGAALVREILARLDAGATAAGDPTPGVPEPPPAAAPAEPAGPALTVLATTLTALFGVFLPALTLVIELASSMCASAFFDPIPTWFSIAVVALVPVANLLAIVALRSPARPAWRAAGWLSGMAMVVAGFYALAFAIVTPFAVVGILFFGLGFLPLSPMLSFVCAWVLRARLRRAALRERRVPPAALWKPLAAGVALFAAVSTPKAVTLAGLRWAAADDAAQRARAVRMLRRFGSEEELLRRSYVNRPFEADPISWIVSSSGDRIPIEKVREVYYRVTGRPFNAVRPPPMRGRRGSIFDEAEWDFAQGGDQVAARVRGLAMTQSRLDGKVEAAAGTAYLEWTMEFRNDSAIQREARAQILLPPGGVVSRLTLWINGEEREAAFGGRSEVRQAYQQVVARRRDPVLVTTAGPDRVLVQCFPVPADGGRMKARIGITFPLAPVSDTETRLVLPRVIESSYGFAGDLKPAVWIEGDGEVRLPAAAGGAAALTVEHPAQGRFAVRGETPAAILEDGACLTILRPAAAASWCRDDRSPGGGVVVQRLEPRPVPAPRRLAVVVDGSASMGGHAAELKAAMAALPAGAERRLFVASDEVIESAGDDPAERIGRQRFEGGCDNVAALVRAWDWAAAGPGGAVLWLHATQPLESDFLLALTQRWERRPDGPPVYACQFGGGPDRIAEKVGGLASFRPVPATGSPGEDLAPLFAAWAGKAGWPVWVWERKAADAPAPAGAVEGSAHVVRLGVADEVHRLARSRANADRAKAVGLARAWQLVTDVSGAVVLETQAQYHQAGLQDIDPATAPEVIPEPGPLALLLFALFALMIRRAAARNGFACCGAMK